MPICDGLMIRVSKDKDEDKHKHVRILETTFMRSAYACHTAPSLGLAMSACLNRAIAALVSPRLASINAHA